MVGGSITLAATGRVATSQGKVGDIPDWPKVREKLGNFVLRSGNSGIFLKSGKSQGKLQKGRLS